VLCYVTKDYMEKNKQKYSTKTKTKNILTNKTAKKKNYTPQKMGGKCAVYKIIEWCYIKVFLAINHKETKHMKPF